MLNRLIVLVVFIQAVHGQDVPGKTKKNNEICTFDVNFSIVKRCARAAQACQLAAETTEGPYYWNSTVRQDIT